jgi:hypothetical protein
VVDAYILNPRDVGNQEIQKLISGALTPLIKAGKLPKDILKHQLASPARTIITEESVDALFALKDKKAISELLPVVMVPAIKPVMPVEPSLIEKALTWVSDKLRKLLRQNREQEQTDLYQALRDSVAEAAPVEIAPVTPKKRVKVK